MLDHREAAHSRRSGHRGFWNATKQCTYSCLGVHSCWWWSSWKPMFNNTFSLWLNCNWCRMAGGNLESSVSWVFCWVQLGPVPSHHLRHQWGPLKERANTRIYSSPPRPKHDLAKPLGLNNYVLLDRIWVLPLAEVMFLQQAIMKICVCFSQLPYCWQMIKTHDISTDCHVFLSLYMTKRAEMSCISLPAHNHKRSKKNLF